LAGVPKGQEETLRGALEGYYINGYVFPVTSLTGSTHTYRSTYYHSFKQIGLVSSPSISRIIEDVAVEPSPKPKKEKTRRRKKTTQSSDGIAWSDFLGYGLVAGSIVGFVGIVWGSFRQ
jgi:hypothetical protein